MSIPKEPRQLMINLMYLVLTAMLALNVSSEILHAFKIINGSIVRSNQSIDSKNGETLLEFQANEDMEGHKDRVKPFNDKAKEVHQRAQELFDYLEAWKKKLVIQAGGYDAVKPGEIKREDNIDASTYLLVENKGGNEIKAKLEDFRQFLIGKVDPLAKTAVDKDLPLQIVAPEKSDNNPTADWATGTFYNVPALGAVTLFAKLQNDVRSSETMILDRLFKEAELKTLKFDAVAAIAVPKTSYVLVGQPVEAQIMFAAYNKSVRPNITPSSGSVTVENGVGTWKGTASGVGMQTVHGTLSLNMGDHTVSEPWDFKYMVGSAGASIQLDKMNVFYIGVPNPITVTAAGYSLEDVSIAIPGTQLTQKGKGTYDVMIPAAGAPAEVTATINAKTESGQKPVGGMKVRVKRIPDPVGKVGGKTNSFFLAASVFRAQLGVSATLDFFDFDAKFQVTSFDFSFIKKRSEYQGPFTVQGPLFRGVGSKPEVTRFMDNAAPGDRVFIDNIKAVGPDKTTRTLPTIVITLN